MTTRVVKHNLKKFYVKCTEFILKIKNKMGHHRKLKIKMIIPSHHFHDWNILSDWLCLTLWTHGKGSMADQTTVFNMSYSAPSSRGGRISFLSFPELFDPFTCKLKGTQYIPSPEKLLFPGRNGALRSRNSLK